MSKHASTIMAIGYVVLVLGQGGFGVASMPVVTIDESSDTWPSGFSVDGFTAVTDDPLGPFAGQAVHFRGVHAGGESIVYRYRLEFDELVAMNSVEISGAAWDSGGTGIDIIRLLDFNRDEIARIDAGVLINGNSFRTVTLPLAGVTGQVFFLEEENFDWDWRFRSNIQVFATVPELLGDLNGDGLINFDDLSPFVAALTDPDGYAAMYPDLDRVALCDTSSDGLCNFDDLSPFARLLTEGQATAEINSAPEPSSVWLLTLAAILAGLMGRSQRRHHFH